MKGVRIEYTDENGKRDISGLVKVKDGPKQLKVYKAVYPDARILDNGEDY